MAAERNEPLQALPAMVGKYRLVAELGTGGMAHVFLAVMRGPHGFNKLVVLKVPRDAVASDPALLAMFHEEARLAARLNHPNVVQTYEVITEEGRDITVMEYLDGQPLHKVIARGRKMGKPLPLGLHLRIISQALTGLQYAHEATDFDGTPLKLVHRDVSPPNLFVTFDGNVKVLDFGIAKAVTSVHETQIGTFKGRIRYMPPEQLRGGKIDRRADIFAVGAVLWDAAAGEGMWKGRTDVEVISAVLNDEVPSPKSVHAEVPDELDAIVRKAMSHEPELRYANCIELQNDIDAFIRTLPLQYGPADLAGHMSGLFAASRAERQRIIESQLAKVRSLETGEYAALPQIDLPPSSLSQLTSSRVSSGGTPPSGLRSLDLIPESVTGSSLAATKQPSTNTAVSAGLEKRRSGSSIALGALGVLVLLGGGVVVGKSLKHDEAAPAASASSARVAASVVGGGLGRGDQEPAHEGASASAGNAPADKAGDVVTVLRAEPGEAHLYLDDAPLASNPFIQRAPRDTAPHTLRAEAKGYVSKSTTIVMHIDSDVVLRLDREAPVYTRSRSSRSSSKEPTAAASPAAPPTPPPVASSTPAPDTKSKPAARPIDSTDPYK